MHFKILITVPSIGREFGGPAAKALALRSALQSLGHDVTVLCSADGDESVVALKPLTHFHGTPIPLGVHRTLSLVRGADLVHVIGYRDPVSTLVALSARYLGVPYLLEPVGTHRRRLRSVKLKAVFDATVGRGMVRRARMVLATSRREASELAEDGVLGSTIAIRPNGIEPLANRTPPSPGRFRARLGLTLDVPLVLSLTRIVRTKGLPLLVAAIAPLRRVHLAIAGPDDRDGTLRAVTEAVVGLGLGDRVHILSGGLWGAEKSEAFVDSDLFCLFSKVESFGMAAAEAASFGLPVVLSDRCGVGEWLGAGAEIVPFGDVTALTGTIAHLLSDEHRRNIMSLRARSAAETLTWDRVAPLQVELYKRVLGQP